MQTVYALKAEGHQPGGNLWLKIYWNVSFEKRLPKAAGDTYENNLKITMNLNSFAPKKRMNLHERNEKA